MTPRTMRLAAPLALALAGACGGGHDEAAVARPAAGAAQDTVAVIDTTISDAFPASGTAEPIQRAVLSTKLMGTVTAVLVREGDAVAKGQVLARVDARDLEAKRVQARSALEAAQAVLHEAELNATRMRNLYADSAAARVQLDAAETGLTRARSGVEAARAGAAEVDVIAGYGEVRAPFAGVVTERHVDAGAFAAPGAPLVTVEDASRLRISVSAPPEAVRAYRRGMPVEGAIEGRAVTAVIEGVVPGPGANLYTVNAVVNRPAPGYLSNAAATLALRRGDRRAVLVPAAAVVRRGDLTGLRILRDSARVELRWVRVGSEVGELVEVLAGVSGGERLLVTRSGEGGR